MCFLVFLPLIPGFWGSPPAIPWTPHHLQPGRSRLKSDVAAAVLAAEAPETRTLRAPYRQLMPNEVPAEWESWGTAETGWKSVGFGGRCFLFDWWLRYSVMKTYEMQIMRSVGLVHCVISWEHEVGFQRDVSCFDTVNHGCFCFPWMTCHHPVRSYATCSTALPFKTAPRTCGPVDLICRNPHSTCRNLGGVLVVAGYSLWFTQLLPKVLCIYI